MRASERIKAIDVLGKYARLEKSNTVRVTSPEVKEAMSRLLDWLLTTPLISDENRETAPWVGSSIWGKRT